MTYTGTISLDCEDAARVAELLLAAGRAADVPRYWRQGALPEMIEAELARSAPLPAPSAQRPVAARSGTALAELEQVVCARFTAQGGRVV
jgi:hypothetical protein